MQICYSNRIFRLSLYMNSQLYIFVCNYNVVCILYVEMTSLKLADTVWSLYMYTYPFPEIMGKKVYRWTNQTIIWEKQTIWTTTTIAEQRGENTMQRMNWKTLHWTSGFVWITKYACTFYFLSLSLSHSFGVLFRFNSFLLTAHWAPNATNINENDAKRAVKYFILYKWWWEWWRWWATIST